MLPYTHSHVVGHRIQICKNTYEGIWKKVLQNMAFLTNPNMNNEDMENASKCEDERCGLSKCKQRTNLFI